MQTVKNIVMYNWAYMDIHINNSRYIFLVVFRYINIKIYTSHVAYNTLDLKRNLDHQWLKQ